MTLRLPNVREALTLFLIAAALAATAILWVRVAHAISNVRPPASSLQATSIVWADRVFQSPPVFTRWLNARGATYSRWSLNHPAAHDRFEHRRPAKRETR